MINVILSCLSLILLPFYLLLQPLIQIARFYMGCDCAFSNPYSHEIFVKGSYNSYCEIHHFKNMDLYCVELIAPGEVRKLWMKNGKLHRSDGPSLESSDGYREWHLDGEKVTPQDVFEQLTPEQKERAIWNLDEWK